MKKFISAALLSSCVALAIGCSGPAANPPVAGPSADGDRFRLTAEPASAQDVKAVRESAKDDEEVTIVGRIGGDVNPWVEGQAAFMVVDNSLKPCNEKDDDACTTPWDYCCDTDVLPQSKAMVKIVGDDGRPLSTDARKLLGLKELQTVVVHGKAKRDDTGNLTVLADGVFVRN